jgi:GTP-binding protein EngB required for normal cell division
MSGTATLQRMSALAREMGAGGMAADADALLKRARAGRFYVACVGEFKRGKSTLINSLLGATVLPTGVVPVTSVPTIVRYGDSAARVQQEGKWHAISPARLADYVSQERNPGNAKRVGGVEVFVPHSLLREGLCLVDTPGLGSIFDANTASTVDFLPQVDAAVVVLGADPPISGEELRFVGELAKAVDTLLFVLNKSDRIPAAQRDEAVAFTRRVLEQALGRPIEPIYQVSAIATGSNPALAEGWHALLGALEQLPRTSGRRLVQRAVARGVGRLRARLNAVIAEELRALDGPLAEFEQRVVALAGLAAGAERAARELEPLLALAERDLGAVFAERRRQFLDTALPTAEAQIVERFDGRLRRDAALALANDIARAQLEPWLVESERAAGQAYAEALSRFTALAREFLARVTALAGVAPDAVRLEDLDVTALDAPRGFYFTDLLRYHISPYPWAGLVDRLTPPPLARRRRLTAARRYLTHLLDVNASRVESDLTNRVYESGTRLRRALEVALREAGQAAIAAAKRGRAARAAGEREVATARQRLDRWRAELEVLATS